MSSILQRMKLYVAILDAAWTVLNPTLLYSTLLCCTLCCLATGTAATTTATSTDLYDAERIQMDQASPFRMDSLYSGVAGSLFGQVPYGVLTFGSYEMYKQSLSRHFPPVMTYALSAILGDLTGSFWLCPSEVIKQQMQAGMYSSTTEAFSKIWSTGGIRGLYQGYWGGVSRDVPFRVAQLTTYEVTKSVYLKYKKRRLQKHRADVQARQRRRDNGSNSANNDDDKSLDLSPIEAAFCGAVAGSFSAAITAPLDRIKTIMMTDSSYATTVAGCAARILREDGLAGLTTGVIPRVVYIAPSVAIFFIAYEQVQQKLK
eukprot:CAMPEP_0198111944 /NCGR_PEP_ID=MMETSP1442-20131203/3858_1 /TAXON_ID= /ORGANISM="Craspedostauros australis, Strain CCMP3328" /LENGTH=315 /DNA_ID=CAMNT_0043768557 /DNA_START=471 /DNA_END=1419 /DNA_ORIENTATION=+